MLGLPFSNGSDGIAIIKLSELDGGQLAAHEFTLRRSIGTARIYLMNLAKKEISFCTRKNLTRRTHHYFQAPEI